MRRFGDRLDVLNGLGFRLGFLLSLAILPLGLISLVQTMNVSREAARSSEVALLGRTAAAAAGERALLQSALGTADALGPGIIESLASPGGAEACSQMLHNFVARNASYVYAGFTGIDGVTRCNSSMQTVDLHSTKTYTRFLETRSTLIVNSSRGAISQRPVVIVAQPLHGGRELLGFVSVSLTHDLLRSTHASDLARGTGDLVTFSNDGEVISTFGGDISALLPGSVPLTSLVSGQEFIFHDTAANGRQRVFAVVPIVPGLAFALGSYSPGDAGGHSLAASLAGAMAIPLALWLVSIGVAYLAVFRLVLRHVRELRGQMRRFAVGDRSELPRVIEEAPAELRDVSQTFHNMARILVRDELQLEEAVVEKTVLLKEVHHRVKNNLQLIASIINMQNRLLDDPDAKRVLRSVQDRVTSLATVYRNLYQAEHLDAVAADHLLRDIVGQLSVTARGLHRQLDVELDIQPLVLVPDQAVPLILLATEALTNAVKYAAPPSGETLPWARVVLHDDPPDHAVLEISNSVGTGLSPVGGGTRLGGQLIEAFATQLDAEAVTETLPDRYLLRLRFRVDRPSGSLRDDHQRSVVLTSAARQGATH